MRSRTPRENAHGRKARAKQERKSKAGRGQACATRARVACGNCVSGAPGMGSCGANRDQRAGVSAQARTHDRPGELDLGLHARIALRVGLD